MCGAILLFYTQATLTNSNNVKAYGRQAHSYGHSGDYVLFKFNMTRSRSDIFGNMITTLIHTKY